MCHITLTDLVQTAPRFVLASAIGQAVAATGIFPIERCIPCQNLTPFPKDNTSQPILDIPIRRVRDDTQIHYVSAVALKLSASCQIPAPDIATSLIHNLNSLKEQPWNWHNRQNEATFHLTTHLHGDLLRHLAVRLSSPGYLHIHMTNVGLWSWLHNVLVQHQKLCTQRCDNPVVTNAGNSFDTLPGSLQDSAELFNAQHAIARCTSLLHLATVIKYATQEYSTTPEVTSTLRENLHILEDSRSVTDANSAEYLILDALIDSFDQVSSLHLSSTGHPKRYLQIAADLSARFQAFHSRRRISATAWQQNPDQIQLHLDLVRLCATVLRSLLEEGVGMAACQQF